MINSLESKPLRPWKRNRNHSVSPEVAMGFWLLGGGLSLDRKEEIGACLYSPLSLFSSVNHMIIFRGIVKQVLVPLIMILIYTQCPALISSSEVTLTSVNEA